MQGVKPPRPAGASCARGCAPPGAVSTHLLHPQLSRRSQSQEKPMFKDGMWHMMGWPYDNTGNTLNCGHRGDRVMGERESGPSLLMSSAKAPVLMGFTALSHLLQRRNEVMCKC